MANSIMTPLSLWKDFDDSLSLDPFRVRREEKDGILYEYVYFSGRKTNEGRVRIYGLFARPVTGESFPAILFLPDAGKDFDLGFINRYVRMGYCVFSVDYSGRCDREKFTQYPSDIVYANYADVGRHMDFVDTDAMGTSWYEWTAVGRYAIRYLRSRPEVARIGVVGVRTGGEIVWKLLLSSEVSCGIPICAAGWLAYRGVNKLEGGVELSTNDERQRFIAGIDSQSYAPFVRSAVLMLCSTNDERFDYDRAYDTYARIQRGTDCVISYTINNSSYIGTQGLVDMDMFLDKHLKGHSVFIPEPLEISIIIDRDGELVLTTSSDDRGEIERIRAFLAEDCAISSQRDWREVTDVKFRDEHTTVFRLNAYVNSKKVFAFAQAEYSSGFTASSKIAFKSIYEPIRNGLPRNRVIFNYHDGADSFASCRVADYALADSILDDSIAQPKITEGFNGISGVSSPYGLKTYRLNNPIYRPDREALLSVDICSWEAGYIWFFVAKMVSGRSVVFRTKQWLSGSKSWEKLTVSSSDFKSDYGETLSSFADGFSIGFNADFKFCVNNLVWL